MLLLLITQRNSRLSPQLRLAPNLLYSCTYQSTKLTRATGVGDRYKLTLSVLGKVAPSAQTRKAVIAHWRTPKLGMGQTEKQLCTEPTRGLIHFLKFYKAWGKKMTDSGQLCSRFKRPLKNKKMHFKYKTVLKELLQRGYREFLYTLRPASPMNALHQQSIYHN